MPARNKVDADRVRELLRQGVSQKNVAIRLGICPSCVNVIARKMREGT